MNRALRNGDRMFYPSGDCRYLTDREIRNRAFRTACAFPVVKKACVQDIRLDVIRMVQIGWRQKMGWTVRRVQLEMSPGGVRRQPGGSGGCRRLRRKARQTPTEGIRKAKKTRQKI